MTLLELRPEHDAAVVEIGIDDIGAMEKHLAVVEPTAAILTAIGPEHLERLDNIQTVAREENLTLSHVAARGGTVIVNLDDPLIRRPSDPSATVITFSMKESRMATVPGLVSSNLGSSHAMQDLIVKHEDANELVLPIPLPGEHNASNLLGAVAVAIGLGLTGDQILKGLASFEPITGRSEVKELTGQVLVLCDYYNANPSSVEAALRLITDMSIQRSSPSSTWVCLADMLELGTSEEIYHRQLSTAILSLGIERVLLFGPRMLWLKDELEKRGYSGILRHFTTRKAMAMALLAGLESESCILIKGSRGMKMEIVWKILQEAPADCTP